MYKIYCLINPLTFSPFYVGATKQLLYLRLNGHINNSLNFNYDLPNKGSVIYKRALLIRDILSRGCNPIIILITNAESNDVDELEKFYYDSLLKTGFKLIQSKHIFTYQGHYCRTDGKLIDRKIKKGVRGRPIKVKNKVKSD